MGTHNHSRRHEHRRKREAQINSKNNRLTIIRDKQGLGWSGI